jgi:hypothetical protein
MKKGGDHTGLVSNRDSKGYLFVTPIRQQGVALKLILAGVAPGQVGRVAPNTNPVIQREFKGKIRL